MARLSFLLLPFALLKIFSLSSCSSVISPQEQRQWESIVSLHESIFMPQFSSYIQLLKNITSDSDTKSTISKPCISSLNNFAQSLTDRDESAMTMFDSSARTLTGLTFDQHVDFGHYHQCLETTFNGFPTRYTILELHYPSINIFHETHPNTSTWTSAYRKRAGYPFPFYIIVGVCLPSQCSDRDIRNVLKSPITRSILPVKLSLLSSQTPAEEPFSEVKVYHRIALSLVIGLIILNIVSTIYFKDNKVLQCFNLQSNHQKLVQEPAPTDHRLHFYSFMKVYWLTLSVVLHNMVPLNLKSISILTYHWRWYQNHGWFNLISTPTLFLNVNTAMTSSIYPISLLPMMERMSFLKFLLSVPMILIARLLRTAPILLVGVLLHLSIPALWSSPMNGPLFKDIYINQTMNCVSNGWKEAFGWANLLTYTQSCISISWFVSCDFHMLICSLLLLWTLGKSLKAGIVLGIIQMIVGTKLHYDYLHSANRPPHYILFTTSDMDLNLNWLVKYTHSFGYISSYPIGIFMGYGLYKTMSQSRKPINGWISLVAFIVSCLVFFIGVIIYDHDGIAQFPNFYLFGKEMEIGLLWSVLQRPIFVTFICLLYYFFFMRSTFFLNLGMSRLCTFIARVSFTAFVFHDVFVVFIQARMSKPMPREGMHVSGIITFVYIISIVGGYLMTLMIEMPTANLLKMMMPGKSPAKDIRDKKSPLDSNHNVNDAQVVNGSTKKTN